MLAKRRNLIFLRPNPQQQFFYSKKNNKVIKRKTNDAGQNVLMEYDRHISDTSKDVQLYAEQEKMEKQLAETYEFPKELVLDHKHLEREIADSLHGKSREDLMRMKFDKTPPTPERYQEIGADASIFLKMLDTPIQSTSVVRLRQNVLSEREKDLSYYLRVRGESLQTYTSWIRGICKCDPEGGYEKAVQVLKDLRANIYRAKFRMDIAIFNSALTGLVGRDIAEIKAQKNFIFSLLDKDRIKPNAITYTTIIDAVVSQKNDGTVDLGRLPESDLDYCYTLVEEARQRDVVPEPSMYTSLIKGCVKQHDAIRAWKTFDHMRVWNCQPDVVLYTEMIHVCGTTGEAERGLDLFDELQQIDLEPTDATFNALLSNFRTRPDMIGECMKVLAQMKEHGFKPDVHTWRHLMEAVQGTGDFNTANLLFDELMRDPQIDPKKAHWAYRSLIWTYSRGAKNFVHKNKCVELTENAYARYLANGLEPNAEILNIVLDVYCMTGRMNRALEMREKFTELGIAPTKATYYSLIKLFAHHRKLERAFDVFNQMKIAGIQPTLYVYSTLINGCTKLDFVMSGMRLLREMKEKGIELAPHHRHILNFRRNLSATPNLIREIDHLTGKDLEFVPGWKKVGGRHQRPDWRNVSDKERKAIAASPVFLPASHYASGTRS